MGAWTFVEPRLRELVDWQLPVTYIGKPSRPSPAQGSAAFNKKEHAHIVRSAFKQADEDAEDIHREEEEAAEETREKAPSQAD